MEWYWWNICLISLQVYNNITNSLRAREIYNIFIYFFIYSYNLICHTPHPPLWWFYLCNFALYRKGVFTKNIPQNLVLGWYKRPYNIRSDKKWPNNKRPNKQKSLYDKRPNNKKPKWKKNPIKGLSFFFYFFLKKYAFKSNNFCKSENLLKTEFVYFPYLG